jgi:hypothetical protein
MMVDSEKGKLTFYKNGASLGDVHTFKPFTDEELFAVVSFYGVGDSVTILPVSSPGIQK